MAKIDGTVQATEKKSWARKSTSGIIAPVIIIHGPPKTGKSRLAATESPMFPRVDGFAVYQRHNPPVVISDQLWLTLDEGGFDGLTEEGIEIEHTLNYRGAIDALGIMKANTEIIQEARSIVKANPQIRTVVVDTLSVYDSYLVEYWSRNTPKVKDKDNPGAMKDDKRTMFGYVNEHHRKNHVAISSIGAPRRIYLCHTRYKGDGDSAESKQKREATDTPYTGNLQPGITGGGAEVYKADGSLCFAMKTTMPPGKEATPTFEVLAWSEGEVEAWSRLDNMPGRISPDLRKALLDYGGGREK